RFTIRQVNWWGGKARGEVYRDQQSLIIEVQNDNAWGGRSEVKELRIPLAEIISISCQTQSWPGMDDVLMGRHAAVKKGHKKSRSKWTTTEIVIKVARPDLLAGLPVGGSGRGRLRVNWGDEEAAQWLIESIAAPGSHMVGDVTNDRREGTPIVPVDPRRARTE